jgi:hypothetical protein
MGHGGEKMSTEDEFCRQHKAWYSSISQSYYGSHIHIIEGFEYSSRDVNNYLLFKKYGIAYRGLFMLKKQGWNPSSTLNDFSYNVDDAFIRHIDTFFNLNNQYIQTNLLGLLKDEFFLFSIRHFDSFGSMADSIKVGDELNFPYYISTSYANTFFNFENWAGITDNTYENRVIFIIKIKKTSPNWMFIGKSGCIPSQYEVVINKNTSLKVTDIRYAPCGAVEKQADGSYKNFYYEFKIISLKVLDHKISASLLSPGHHGGDFTGENPTAKNDNNVIKLFGSYEEDLIPYKDELKKSDTKIILIPDITSDITNVDEKNEKQYYSLISKLMEKTKNIIQYNDHKLDIKDILYFTPFEKFNDFYGKKKPIDKLDEKPVKTNDKKLIESDDKKLIKSDDKGDAFNIDDEKRKTDSLNLDTSKFAKKYLKYKNKYIQLKNKIEKSK